MAEYRYYVTTDRHGTREFDGNEWIYDLHAGHYVIDDDSGDQMVINGNELVDFTRESLKKPATSDASPVE